MHPSVVGGQEKAITPALDRANIAIFVFKARIGQVTWEELEHSRSRKESPIPVIAFFPADAPSDINMKQASDVKAWGELLDKKESLTEGWSERDGTSLTPSTDYDNVEHLKSIAFDRLKASMHRVLYSALTNMPETVTIPAMPSAILGEIPGLSYDRQPVLIHTIEEIDQQLVQRFLQRRLSQSLISAQIGSRDTSTLPVSQSLQLLGCVYQGRPTHGAFLCFAPPKHLVDKFGGCSLQLVTYDKTSKAFAKASIDKESHNLVELFERGIRMAKYSFRVTSPRTSWNR